MKNLSQAVILCGGLGARLLPITKNIPKPMVIINEDKPFLFYLLDQLASQGIKDFLLLTGYLSRKIKDYFKDGSFWGWNITYSEGPVDWGTGKRIWEAKDKISSNFMLLYSDNYAEVSLKSMTKIHMQNQSLITLLLKRKKKGNIEIYDDKILTYDPTRTKNNLNYVELGYMIINRKILLNFFDKVNVSLEYDFSSLLELFIYKKKVSFKILDTEYYSISDVKRLNITRKFLLPKKILLLDRDGTINHKAPKGEYIKDIESVKFVQETIQSLKVLSKKGFTFVVISNQAGIGRKIVSEQQVNNINNYIKKELIKLDITIERFYICPHHWNDNCKCRKPNPQLFFQVSKDFCIPLNKVLYVGDDIRDCYAAENAGTECLYIGEIDLVKKTKFKRNYFLNLKMALPLIEKFYK